MSEGGVGAVGGRVDCRLSLVAAASWVISKGKKTKCSIFPLSIRPVNTMLGDTVGLLICSSQNNKECS